MIEARNEVDITGDQMKGMEEEAQMILGVCRHQGQIATNQEVWADRIETMMEDLDRWDLDQWEWRMTTRQMEDLDQWDLDQWEW